MLLRGVMRPLALEEGRVQFRNVVEKGVERNTLHGTSFLIEPGKMNTLVNAQNLPKSTIYGLLFNSSFAYEGSILIDGQEVAALSTQSIKEAIGVVPKHPILFPGTVMINLRCVSPTSNEEDIINACREAGLHEHILTLPGGYNSIIGYQQNALSEEYKQRVSIARLILQNPKIILFEDDSFLAQLLENSQNPGSFFQKFIQGRSVIVASAHNTIFTNTHRFIIIDKGIVVQEGTHEDLIETRGIYKSLYSTMRKELKGKATTLSALNASASSLDLRLPQRSSIGATDGSLASRRSQSRSRDDGVRLIKGAVGTAFQVAESVPGMKQAIRAAESVMPTAKQAISVVPGGKHAIKAVDSILSDTKRQGSLKPDAPEFIPNRFFLKRERTASSGDSQGRKQQTNPATTSSKHGDTEDIYNNPETSVEPKASQRSRVSGSSKRGIEPSRKPSRKEKAALKREEAILERRQRFEAAVKKVEVNVAAAIEERMKKLNDSSGAITEQSLSTNNQEVSGSKPVYSLDHVNTESDVSVSQTVMDKRAKHKMRSRNRRLRAKEAARALKQHKSVASLDGTTERAKEVDGRAEFCENCHSKFSTLPLRMKRTFSSYTSGNEDSDKENNYPGPGERVKNKRQDKDVKKGTKPFKQRTRRNVNSSMITEAPEGDVDGSLRLL